MLKKKSNIYPTPPQMSNGQPLRGLEKKRICHKCHPSTKWLAHVHHVVVFRTKLMHFKIENTPTKDTNGKKKFKRMLSSFLWTNKSFSRNSTLFSTRWIGALGLFWTNQGSKVSEDTWGTFHTLWSKKSTFLKRNFCIYKCFKDLFYILTSPWKKNHTMCIWNWFFAMCSTD